MFLLAQSCLDGDLFSAQVRDAAAVAFEGVLRPATVCAPDTESEASGQEAGEMVGW